MKCHLGCGQPALFFHAKTGIGRCSKNVSSCPITRSQRIKQHASRRIILQAKEQEILSQPELCACGAAGEKYSKRYKRWRCGANRCPASVEKWEKTIEKRYGTSTLAHIEGLQEKRSETLIKTHANRSDEEKKSIQHKRESTLVERYGVNNISHSKTHREKAVATTQKNHGVDYTLQSDTLYKKVSRTMLNRYGADHPAHVPEIVAQKKATMVERWGVEYPYQSEEIREKFIETVRERWGEDHPMHIAEIFEKQQIAAHKWKEFTLPSGAVVLVQGYEPLAINFLFEQGYKECDLNFKKPIIPYIDDFSSINPINRRYFPDLWLPAKNHIVEVKSEFTLINRGGFNHLKNKAKQSASKQQGYNFTFMIFDRHGKNLRMEGDPL